MKQRHYPSLGAISESTTNIEDLIDAFTSELSYHMKCMRLTREQRKRCNDLLAECCGFIPDDITRADILDELFDALDEIAAPYTYFGAHEGDGACFGFWPIADNEELPRLVAGDPIPMEHWGEDVYLINDRGNVTCAHVNRRGRLNIYWECV